MTRSNEGLELYRPSNISEGEAFMDEYCRRCARDAGFRDETDTPGCQILLNAMMHEVTDPEYPRYWVIIGGEACCTAFAPEGDEPEPLDMDDKTLDMFEHSEIAGNG